MPTLRVIGPGRAGLSLSEALMTAGWRVLEPVGRGGDVAGAAVGADLVVIATPDAEVAGVAAAMAPQPHAVVAHLAGSLGLDVLAPHDRRASLHPLVALPDPTVGAARLQGAWFAVAGDDLVEKAVADLGGRLLRVPDDRRAAYHAAACIASNHLVALLGSVERVAAGAGVPLEAYLDLVRATVDNVAALGPAAALTGPAARGDWATIEAHRAAIPDAERDAYEVLLQAAVRLAAQASGESSSKVQVMDTVASFRKALDEERRAGRTVGLVPTMGFLHDGHASLMRRAASECDVVAVTIFVNPLQFAAHEDLDSYPRDLDGDIALAERSGVDYIFAPSVQEMYPRPMLTTVRVTKVSEPLDGQARPGHFDGVATVVAKLFAITGACRAYFGEKDFQQLAVVRRMAADLSLPVDVVGCPTVREPDGLAMSSRNAYLDADERGVASVLHQALQVGRRLVEDEGERRPDAVRAAMAAAVGAEPRFELDYAEVVDAADLTTPTVLAGELRLLIAARLGRARLIDNISATTGEDG